MISFQQVPYLRPDIEALEREMGEKITALENAESFEQAYFALMDLEAPRRR